MAFYFRDMSTGCLRPRWRTAAGNFAPCRATLNDCPSADPNRRAHCGDWLPGRDLSGPGLSCTVWRVYRGACLPAPGIPEPKIISTIPGSGSARGGDLYLTAAALSGGRSPAGALPNPGVIRIARHYAHSGFGRITDGYADGSPDLNPYVDARYPAHCDCGGN